MRAATPLVLSALMLVGGCAARGAMHPAKAISASLSSLHSDLSVFQDRASKYQDAEQVRTEAMAARREAAAAAVRQALDEQALSQAKSSPELFALLQSQGRDETAKALTVSVSAPPPAVKMPLDKITQAAKATGAIAKGPSRKAEVDSLVAYAGKVNSALEATEKATAQAANAETKSQ